jgi:tetratricopeptide (TPR) repeat protein
MRADPGLHARILWNKLRLTLGAYEVPDNHDLEWDARYLALLRAPWPGWGVVGTLGLAGLVAFLASSTLRRRLADGGAAWELGFAFALYAATIVLTVTSMRARLPLVVPLGPFAGLALVSLAGRLPGRGAVLAGLAIALPVVHWPVFDADERRADLDKRDFNLAVYRLQDGDVDGARALAERLAARYPGTARVETLLAQLDAEAGLAALRSEGSRDAAGEALESALGRLQAVAAASSTNARERFRARRLAGSIQRELGRPDAALGHFRAARDFDPDDPLAIAGITWALESRAAAGPIDVQALESTFDELGPTPAARLAAAAAQGRVLLLWSERDPERDARSELLGAARAAFRRGLVLDASSVDCALGLANALWLHAELLPPDDATAARDEARALVEDLASKEGLPPERVADLRRRMGG